MSDTFRRDIFFESLMREANRVYVAPHLSNLEQETFCRALQLTATLVYRAIDYPIGNGSHLPEDLHLRLHEVLGDINVWQQEGQFIKLDYMLERHKASDVINLADYGKTR